MNGFRRGGTAAGTATAAMVLAMLGGCSRGPTHDPEVLQAIAQAKRMTVADAEKVGANTTDMEYPLYLSMLKASGVEAELGGRTQTEAALHALMGQWHLAALGARAAMPQKISDTPGVESSYGFTGLGASAFTGTLTGMISNSLVDTGKFEQGGDGKSISIDVTASKLALDVTYNGNVVDGLSGKVATSIAFDRCPDSAGKVGVKFTSKSSLGKSGSKGGANLNISVDGSFHYDDDAHLMSDWEADTHVEHAAFNGTGKGSYLEATRHIGGSDLSKYVNRIDRVSSQATKADAEVVGQQVRAGELMAMMILHLAGSYVQEGKCVTLNTPVSPTKRSHVKPSTHFDIQAQPRSKIEGSPTGGTVVGKLEGEGALDPAGSKIAADAKFSYVAPDQKQKKGVVKLEARSRRGVGLADLAFDTGTRALFAQGGADYFHGHGLICDIEQPFEIHDDGVVNHYTPTSASGGTYTYSGTLGGFAVFGHGTYTVKLDPDGEHGTIDATGPGSVKTPMGIRTAKGTEHYTLQPGAECTANE